MDGFSQDLTEQDRQTRLSSNSEVQRIQRSIENVVEKIIHLVGKRDRRLSGTLFKVGSFYSGLKINLPDEFDFLVEIQFVEKDDFEVRPSGFKGTRNLWRTPNGYPGLKKILVKSNHFQGWNDGEDDSTKWLHKVCGSKTGNCEYILDPVGVKNTFFYAVTDVLEHLDKSGFPRYLSLDSNEYTTFMYGPSVTLFFVWNGRYYKHLKISVDLTVCLKATSWEDHFDFHRLSEKNGLKEHFLNLIYRHGYHLIPYISNRGHKQWKISTSYLETAFFSKFHVESKLKMVVRIIKLKRDKFVKFRPDPSDMKDPVMAECVRFVNFYSGCDYDENYRSLLSSYLIKNALFDAICHSSLKEIQKMSLSRLYIHTCLVLYFTIAKNEARNFFISGSKLNVPAFGDILPGFHQIFNEVKERFLCETPEEEEHCERNMSDDNVLNPAAMFDTDTGRLKRLVRMTISDIKCNYDVLWKSDQARNYLF